MNLSPSLRGAQRPKQSSFDRDQKDGLLRGVYHRAALRADPLARNDGLGYGTLTSPACGGGRRARRARRVGEVSQSTLVYAEAPPPQPSPASGRGGAAAQVATPSTTPGGRFCRCRSSAVRR